ncbi:MAG: hypothetical protein PHI12_12360 [Dehalococcoidales bacterium]|nr:hypothetical protein [Dehalococcoidales bacterium]
MLFVLNAVKPIAGMVSVDVPLRTIQAHVVTHLVRLTDTPLLVPKLLSDALNVAKLVYGGVRLYAILIFPMRAITSTRCIAHVAKSGLRPLKKWQRW